MEIDTQKRLKPENILLGSEPRLYVCSGDGLGSTGKTAIQQSLRENLGILLHRVSVGFFKEPPEEELAGNSPYGITTQGLVAKEALGPYLAAVRGFMWDSQANTPWKVPSNPIIIGDRSPAASFLQDAYPGGNNPYGNEYWKLLYGKMDWVPFPDILPLLFPDDINKQIQRLEERGRNGDTVDQFDNPDKQIKQFEGFKALADILFKFPGVYKIISGEIRRGYEDLKSVDPGFILSLLTTAYAIEKGVTPGIKETSLGQFIRYGGIKRIEGNQSITAYAIDLTLTPYFIEASGGETTRRVLKEYLTARFGDIGICWPYADNLGTSPFKAVVYALEPGAKGLKTEEVHDYINTRIKLSLVEVNKETRYGKDLFKSRFSGIQRAWRNITW